MRSLAATMAILSCGLLSAQWTVPGPVVLDGNEGSARQVLGLASPLDERDGMSLSEARSRAVITASGTGASILAITLDPAPSTLVPGMEISLIPSSAHPAAPTLQVNGFGPYPIVRATTLPLDSAEMPVGAPARLVFDGERFHLLNNGARPCPTGFTAATNNLCVADSSRAAADFRNASLQCAQLNARLCSLSEWAMGCQRVPGFLATVSSLEWVDHATNSQDQGKLAGIDRLTQVIGCTFGDTDVRTALRRFRCCTTR